MMKNNDDKPLTKKKFEEILEKVFTTPLPKADSEDSCCQGIELHSKGGVL